MNCFASLSFTRFFHPDWESIRQESRFVMTLPRRAPTSPVSVAFFGRSRTSSSVTVTVVVMISFSTSAFCTLFFHPSSPLCLSNANLWAIDERFESDVCANSAPKRCSLELTKQLFGLNLAPSLGVVVFRRKTVRFMSLERTSEKLLKYKA